MSALVSRATWSSTRVGCDLETDILRFFNKTSQLFSFYIKNEKQFWKRLRKIWELALSSGVNPTHVCSLEDWPVILAGELAQSSTGGASVGRLLPYRPGDIGLGCRPSKHNNALPSRINPCVIELEFGFVSVWKTPLLYYLAPRDQSTSDAGKLPKCKMGGYKHIKSE